MRYLAVAAAAAWMLAGAGTAGAQVANHVYRLNGSLADSLGGPALTLENAAVLGSTGVTFPAASGLRLTDAALAFTTGAAYSVEVRFSFDQVSGYRRVINTSLDDNGAYVRDGLANYFNSGPNPGGVPIAPGALVSYVLARDATETSLYVNGGLAVRLAGDIASSRLTGDMLFFVDDSGEQASGFADYIRTFDAKLGDAEVAALYAGGGPENPVPEPATWAMMLAGLGAVGGAARRSSVGWRLRAA